MRKTLLMLVVGALVVALAGCGSSSSSKAPSSNAPSSNAAQPSSSNTVGTIVIGESEPLSGPISVYGVPEDNAQKIAVKEINDSGGLDLNGKKYNLKLICLDDQDNPTLALENVKKLIDVDHAQFLCGFTDGPLIVPSYPYIQQKKIVTLVAGAPAIDVTSVPNPYAFRLRPPMDYTGMATGTFLANEFHVKRLAILWSSDITAFKGLIDGTANGFKAAGGTVTTIQGYHFTSQDMTPQLTAAIATHPDCIYAAGPVESAAFVYKQARDLGYKGLLLGMSGGSTQQFTKIMPISQLNGIYDLIPAEINPSDYSKINGPAAGTLLKEYQDAYQVDAPPVAGYNYDAIHVLADAIRAAGTTDPDAVVKEMANMSVPGGLSMSWISVDGKLFDQNHQAYIPNVAFVWKNGKKIVYKTMGSPVAQFSAELHQLRLNNTK